MMKAQRGMANATPVVLTMPGPVSPFERNVQEIYGQVAQRAYQLFEQRGHAHGNHDYDWLRAESEMFQPVPIEIQDANDSFSVHAEVPGFNVKDLDIRVEPARLLIRGKAENGSAGSKGKTIYSECESNEIFRMVSLPEEINPKQATASLSDGILSLTLPKAAEAKATRLEVKAA